jgi:hypothetical protein
VAALPKRLIEINAIKDEPGAAWIERSYNALHRPIHRDIEFRSSIGSRRREMNLRRPTRLAVPLVALATMGSVALAQAPSQQPTDHTAHHGATAQPTEQPAMGGCPMMGGMMGQSKQGMKTPGMMQGDMRQGRMTGLFGSRVTPIMNLSAEDVRGYLAVQVEGLNNKRLKVGDIKIDDETVTADIVTVDNSLVQRLKVNRHTGAIDYQD